MTDNEKIHLKFALTNNHAIFLCVFLSCLVPRYISTFKLHIGIDISFYTIATVIVWIIFARCIIIKKNIESMFFFIWLSFIVLSVWRAENIGIWGFYLEWILTAVLFRQLLTKCHDETTNEYIVKALTDALFVHLLIGLYEITAHRYLFEVGNVSPYSYGHVAIGIFHNLNDYSTFVTTMVPFAIYRLLISKRFIEKIYTLFITITSLYLILINGSRASILTLMIFIIAGILMFAKKSTKNLLITGGGISLLGILLYINFRGIGVNLINVVNANMVDINYQSDIVRINLIKNGLYFLKETFGFGVGAGNLYSWLNEKSVYYIGNLRFIHNWYLEILVTFGVLFFGVYIYFHGRLLYKLFSKNYGMSWLKTTMFLSFVCFSIVSISSSSNIYSEWVWMYLVVISWFSELLKSSDDVNGRIVNPDH